VIGGIFYFHARTLRWRRFEQPAAFAVRAQRRFRVIRRVRSPKFHRYDGLTASTADRPSVVRRRRVDEGVLAARVVSTPATKMSVTSPSSFVARPPSLPRAIQKTPPAGPPASLRPCSSSELPFAQYSNQLIPVHHPADTLDGQAAGEIREEVSQRGLPRSSYLARKALACLSSGRSLSAVRASATSSL
jgi:hypothetical protein